MTAADPGAALAGAGRLGGGGDGRRAERGGVMRTRIKVCGITRLDDARAGRRASASTRWASCSGRGSPRCVSPSPGGAPSPRALPPFVTTVGVFVNQPLDEIRAIAAERRAAARSSCTATSRRACGRSVPGRCIKAVGVGARVRRGRRRRLAGRASWPLLDAHDPERRGGTGRTVDWDAAARRGPHAAHHPRRRPRRVEHRRRDRAGAPVRGGRVVGRRARTGDQGRRPPSRVRRARRRAPTPRQVP